MTSGPPPGMTIRKATAHEWRSLAAMLFDLKRMNGSSTEPDLDAFLARYGVGVQTVLQDDRSTIWVATHQDKAIAMLSTNWRPVMRLGGVVGAVEEIYIDPAHRRCGVATALWRTAVADLRARGAKAIEVTTSLAHPGQRSFARKIGLEYYSTVHRVWLPSPD